MNIGKNLQLISTKPHYRLQVLNQNFVHLRWYFRFAIEEEAFIFSEQQTGIEALVISASCD